MSDLDGAPDALEDLSAAQKFVYFLVVRDEARTLDDLQRWLPERTVRRSLEQLEDAELVTRQWADDDPRRRVVRPAPAPPAE